MRNLLLALGITHKFRVPTETGKSLIEQIDVLEIKSVPEPKWLPQNSPRIYHSSLGLVEKEFRPTFTEIAPYLLERGIELFSCDFGPACVSHAGERPASFRLSRDQVKGKIAKAVDHIRKDYPHKVAVENYNYYPTGLYDYICEPVFISECLNEFDLGLVLDLGHAAVSAHNLKMDFWEYIYALPLDRVMELHLSRAYIPKESNELARDAHYSPGLREFKWLRQILNDLPQEGPDLYLTIEPHRRLSNLLEAMFRARDFVDSLN